MAFSPLRSKALHHNRSLSLPSKLNPATTQLDQNLSNLIASETASCSSLSSMKNGVTSLRSLYTSIDNLLLLPNIQQIISEEKSVDLVLDGYICLLDACTTAKDLVSNTKQGVQELLSALRRKDVDGIRCYLDSRRKSKKNILKSLKALRSFRSKQIVESLEQDSETKVFFCKLKDAESVTVSMLESLLSYLIGTRMQARPSGWSLVTKLLYLKTVTNYQGEETNLSEFEKMDAFLQTSLEDIQVDDIMKLLKEIDSSIQNLEEELECLFRQLIRTRVFLLNILNH